MSKNPTDDYLIASMNSRKICLNMKLFIVHFRCPTDCYSKSRKSSTYIFPSGVHIPYIRNEMQTHNKWLWVEHRRSWDFQAGLNFNRKIVC